MKDFLINKEAEIDAYFDNLSIWKYSFYTIYLSLCYRAERIDFDNNSDSAGDFLSRIGNYYKNILKHTDKTEFKRTWDALEPCVSDIGFHKELNFLYAYGHFSLLMPQIHRDLFDVKIAENKNVLLTFKNQEYINAEINDRFLSEISLPFALGYPRLDKIQQDLEEKVSLNDTCFDEHDITIIKNINDYYLKNLRRVEILPDNILVDNLGFNNLDFLKFEASLRALSDFLINLARAYKYKSERAEDLKEKDRLCGEYLELVNCCFTYKLIDLLVEISGLEIDIFKEIFSYFCTTYSTPKDEIVKSNTFVGESYLPPFVLTRNNILFSPHSIRNFLSFNNVIYSLSKTNQKLFDQKISSQLEPTLIFQVDRIFSKFGNLKIKKNVNYRGGEIDYLVLSEDEKVCLVFQVKATLAPINSRTTERVETRSLEGLSQLKAFRSKTGIEKLKLINDTFNVNLQEVTFIDILLVRSCAGSEAVWSTGELIINYQLLCGFIGKKLSEKNYTFTNFDKEIRKYLEEIVAISTPYFHLQNLDILDLSIEFPIIEFPELFKSRIKILKDSSSLGDYYTASIK